MTKSSGPAPGDPSPSANLQLTVAESARLLNVSERLIYMCRELVATGDEELSQAVERGEMTVFAALKIAKPNKYDKSKQTSLNQLISAWRGASASDQAAFLSWIEGGNPQAWTTTTE